jgi:hypothetical protein
LDSNDAYGATLAVAQHEEMASLVHDMPGLALRKPGGGSYRYELVVLERTLIVLFPLRFASDGSTDHHGARLRTPVSDFRQRLLGTSSMIATGQLTFDHALLDADELEAALQAEDELREQLASKGRVVTIAYSSSPTGIFKCVWGDMEVVDAERGTMIWHHSETLNIYAPADRRPHLHAVGGTSTSEETFTRFDAGTAEPVLGLVPRQVATDEPAAVDEAAADVVAIPEDSDG